MKKYFLSLVVMVFVSLYYSCTKDHTSPPVTLDCKGVNDTTNTYNLNIFPNILDFYCSGTTCHSGGAANGGVDLSSYSTSVDAFKTKNVICAVKGAGCERMPKTGAALADSLIKQMECWANNGYKQ